MLGCSNRRRGGFGHWPKTRLIQWRKTSPLPDPVWGAYKTFVSGFTHPRLGHRLGFQPIYLAALAWGIA